MRGLYVDRWRKGLRNEQEVNDLINFARECKITDLYLHNPRPDVATAYRMICSQLEGFDAIQYCIDNFDGNVHLWYSLFKLWRTPLIGALPDELPTEEIYGVQYLKGNELIVQDFLINQLSETLNRYPELYGVHFEKLFYPSTDLTNFAERLVTACGDLKISSNLRIQDIIYPNIEPIPLALVGPGSDFNNRIQIAKIKGATKIAIDILFFTGSLQERLSLLNGLSPVFFNYGECKKMGEVKAVLNA